jgi:hypothetical protein
MFSRMQTACAATALAAALAAAPAEAVPVSATVTADNFYALYKGPLSPGAAGDLTMIGRNESTYGHQGAPANPNSLPGCSGAYNWSCPEVFDFDLAGGETFYLAVWDDGTVAESWIGQFTVGSTTYLSNRSDWEYFVTDIDNPALAQPGAGSGPLPTLGQVFANVLDANDAGDGDGWLEDPYSRGQNGSQPWGLVSGVSSDALFLSSLPNDAQVSNPHVTLYRLEVSPVEAPEPAALGLFAAGLFGAAALRRRRRPARA